MSRFYSPWEIERLGEAIGNWSIGNTSLYDRIDALEKARDDSSEYDDRLFTIGRPFRDGGEYMYEVVATPLFDYMLEGAGFDIWWDCQRMDYSLNATLKDGERALERLMIRDATARKMEENITEWRIYWPKSKRVVEFQQRFSAWLEALVPTPLTGLGAAGTFCTKEHALSVLRGETNTIIEAPECSEFQREQLLSLLSQYGGYWPNDAALDDMHTCMTLDMIERERVHDRGRVSYRKVL
jgi:hypothetical protein